MTIPQRLKLVLPDIGLSVAAGIFLILSSPGVDIWPLAYLAFAFLFWVFDRQLLKPWKAAYITGFTFYIICIAWVSVPMTLFGGAPQWAGSLLVLFTALVCGLLFWAVFGYIWGKTRSVILVGLVIVALEMLKGKYFFGGLPWLNIAQTQYNNPVALQIVSVLGEYGLSFLVVLAGGYLYKAVRHRYSRDIGILAAAGVLLFGFGQIRLMMAPVEEPTHYARMVQTGIEQKDKWDREKREMIKETLMERVNEAAHAPGSYDILLLPESSFNVNPFMTREVFLLLQDISHNAPVLVGYDRRINAGETLKLYNSMAMIWEGRIAQNYDKMKLAPFGEYFPLEKQLYPIRRFFFGEGPLFTPGIDPVVFTYKDLSIAPLICFEASFSEIIRARVLAGANVLVTASNESWFGESLGRNQRLAIDTIHSVEHGRYMLRVTQDGITTVISPYGAQEGTFPEKTFHYGDGGFIPWNTLTLFSRLGYIWYVIALAAYGFHLLARRRKNTV